MDNPLEALKNGLQGDIEIAGKRVPKLAIVAGGGVLIGGLILISRKGIGSSGASASPLGEQSGTGSALEGDSNVASDFLGGALQDISNQFSGQLAEQNTQLSNLISQNASDTQSYLDSQIAGVYDQLSQGGAQIVPSFADNFIPAPIDNVPLFQPETFVSTPQYPPDFGYPVPQTNFPTRPVNKVPKPSKLKDKITTIMPKPKPPKPGVLQGKPGIGKRPPRPSNNPSITNFNREPVTITRPVLSAQTKQPNRPVIKQPEKGVGGRLGTVVSPQVRRPVISLPSPQNHQPSRPPTPRRIVSAPAYRPSMIPPNVVPYITPYRPPTGVPIGTKISPKTTKKGR